MSKAPRRRPSIRMLVDACVWLDLVRDPCAPALIGALEELVAGGDVTLVVAPAIVEEFTQNRAWLLEEGGQSISRTRRRVETKGGRSPRKARTVADELNAIDLELVNLGDRAAETVARIEVLLAGGELHEPTDAIKARAAERGMLRKAPFHRPRNGTNDAILVEIYANMVARKGGGQRFAFVTHNTKDFSHPTINQKAAHPDLAASLQRMPPGTSSPWARRCAACGRMSSSTSSSRRNGRISRGERSRRSLLPSTSCSRRFGTTTSGSGRRRLRAGSSRSWSRSRPAADP